MVPFHSPISSNLFEDEILKDVDDAVMPEADDE
jgi:hypothetical protein